MQAYTACSPKVLMFLTILFLIIKKINFVLSTLTYGAGCMSEALEQEKYVLQNAVDSKNQLIESQTSEIELQKKEADELVQKVDRLQKENTTFKKRIQNGQNEKAHSEKCQEETNLENDQLKKKVLTLEQQIENMQHFNEISIIENGQEEILKVELGTSLSRIKELEDAMCKLHFELECIKLNENRLTNLVKQQEENIDDRDKEISTLTAEMQKAQEHSAELQCEIENLKLEQVDVRRRGNSVFGELDDRRQLVESEYKTLKTGYTFMKRKYEENNNELIRCKGQMSILLSMTSRGYQDKYIEKLENALTEKKNEVEELTLKLAKAVKSHQVSAPKIEIDKSGEYNYLRVLYSQTEEKVKELENELMTVRMQQMEHDSKLAGARRLLYETQEELDCLKGENVKLKLDLHQLTFKPECSAEKKPKLEALPGFNHAILSDLSNIHEEKSPNSDDGTSARKSSPERNGNVTKTDNVYSRNYKSTTKKRDENCAHQ